MPLPSNHSARLSRQQLDEQRLTQLLMKAASLGDFQLLKKRLAQGASPTSTCRLTGRTALIAAAAQAWQIDMAAFLLPLSDLGAAELSGRTALSALISPLFCRSIPDNHQVWLQLARALAPSSTSKLDSNGRNALMQAPLPEPLAAISFYRE